MALKQKIDKAERRLRRTRAERRTEKRKARARAERRKGGVAWDLAPIMVLASAGVALLQEPQKSRDRKAEPGRGRFARSPQEIPKRGWKDILLRVKKEFAEDQVPLVAAGVTFYTLLALFPGIAAFVGLYGLFADVGDAQKHLAALSWILPPAALQFVGEQMIRIAASGKDTQSFAFIFGLLASIWSANGAVKSLMTGLNIAYEETERRKFVKKTLISLGFTMGFIAFVLGAVAVLAAPAMIETFVGKHAATLFSWISWPVLLVVMTAGLALLYRYGPSRDPVKWKWISWGSAGVMVFWLAASALFSVYVGNFAHYDKTYGSLGAVIGFMMWIYLSTVVVLAGAEINSEIEHQTTVDTTKGPPKPLGLRGAAMADTVGAAQGRR